MKRKNIFVATQSIAVIVIMALVVFASCSGKKEAGNVSGGNAQTTQAESGNSRGNGLPSAVKLSEYQISGLTLPSEVTADSWEEKDGYFGSNIGLWIYLKAPSSSFSGSRRAIYEWLTDNGWAVGNVSNVFRKNDFVGVVDDSQSDGTITICITTP